MRRPRSGSHLELIGDIWYYRRVVPPDVRDVFGKKVVRKSLETSSHIDAKRLEKERDVEFEAKLAAARQQGPDGYPRDGNARLGHFVDQVFNRSDYGEPGWLERGLAEVPAVDRNEVKGLIEFFGDEEDRLEAEQDQFWNEELKDLIPWSHEPDEWAKTRAEIADLLRNYRENRHRLDTLEWALQEWRKARNRPPQTQEDAERYLTEFKSSAKVSMLSAVRRRHVTDWREVLKRDNTLAPGSINHRLEIVSAILRHGWREAEIPDVPDLTRINVEEQRSSSRSAWTRDQLLKALGTLEPHSWSAWVFIVGLTTGTRLGEPIAARREWYDSKGFIHVPAEYTKMKKPHCLPLIGLIRGPMARHAAALNTGEFLFDAPRPAKPTLKIGHEASKWFGRFFDKHGIDKVFHEIRHTWINVARYESPVKKEIYEIISGHSPKTISDEYGGENPAALLKANERICRHFLDGEMREAVRRLVG